MPPRCGESLRLSARTGRKTYFYSRPLCRKGLAFVAAATEAAVDQSVFLVVGRRFGGGTGPEGGGAGDRVAATNNRCVASG